MWSARRMAMMADFPITDGAYHSARPGSGAYGPPVRLSYQSEFTAIVAPS